jgi:phosphotransferase system HPr (HPr) family protein
MIKKTLVITAEEGLHARPASLLAKVTKTYKSDINMYREGDTGEKYQPKSILSIMSLGAGHGDSIVFTAEGEDEKAAIDAIESLIVSNFEM